MTNWETIERQRLELQAELDGAKTGDARNRKGQFATPTSLAREIVEHGLELLGKGVPIRFFDPAIGTGSFYSALCAFAEQTDIEHAKGFEIDPHYGEPAQKLWRNFNLEIELEDFTKAEPREGDYANLLICNPPYVRHHHINAVMKAELQNRTYSVCGMRVNGLSGLYCYFMGLSHGWMMPGAITGWLVPSEFMGVNYGRQIKEYLIRKVTLLQVHRFDPENIQFDDALVSSAIVWFKNECPVENHNVLFSYGGTLKKPKIRRQVPLSEINAETKWTRYPHNNGKNVKAQVVLGDLFDIKRGLVTGDNKFFILEREKIEKFGLPMECFTPILPGSRFLPENEIGADEKGFPLLDRRLFLLNTQIPENEIAKRYPALKSYLDSGQMGEKPVSSRYICRSRRPWYAQENRPPAPIICTYMGRGRNGAKPFRFILNYSEATASNVFLMLYPKSEFAEVVRKKPEILRAVWNYLNEINSAELLEYGRVYGGGLHKLEPNELRSFPADGLLTNIPDITPVRRQMELV